MVQHVIIVGGGVIGACCAHELHKAGHDVTLLDAGSLGHGCSYGNSGFLAPGHGPLCAPGVFERAIESKIDPDAPWIYSQDDPDIRQWMQQFSTFCTPEHEAHCLDVLDALGRDMIDRFAALLDETGIACDFHARGSECVACEQESVADLEAEADSMRSRGYDARVCKPGDESLAADALEPGWLCTEVILEGASLNPYRFVCGLVDLLAASGVNVYQHAPMQRVRTNAGHAVGITLENQNELDADAVVIATGMSASTMLAPFGIDLPLKAAKGYHVDVRVLGRPIERPVILADFDTILTPMDDFVRISGTVEFTGTDDSLRDRRTDALYQRGLQAAPFLRGGDVVSRWLGRRPALPDGLPTIGRVPTVDNLFVATGHARLGLSLAPKTGELIRGLVEGTPSPILEHLAVERFGARTPGT